MAHQGLKQHIDLSISRLSTYEALRDEIIKYSRARRTWTDPNAMQVECSACERQSGTAGPCEWLTLGQGPRRQRQVQEGKQGQGGKKAASKFEGKCSYCLKRGHKKADCRKMKSDIAAGKCDKSGKPIGVKALSAAGGTLPASELCTEHGKHHRISTDGDVVHQYDRTGPENSHGC